VDKKKLAVENTIEKNTINTGNLLIKSTDSSLRGKIKTNIVEPDGTIYWYIRFNMSLDPASVSKYTMNVTERSGYILNTIITYDERRNMIVLNPTDLYRQNEYYLLNISKKVKSAKGTHLKKSVHILFKLLDDKISEFEILKNTANLPRPRKKPKSIRRAERQELAASKIYADSGPIHQNIGTPNLPYGPMHVNPLLALIGVVLLGISIYVQNYYFSLGALVICIIGILHVVFQGIRKRARSAFSYMFGVILFNFSRYPSAERRFKKALNLDPTNELAEYAIGKVSFYLK